ncbi:MAG: DHH family phosphoesterase [Candidatus Bathyarchaeia archaeon]
MGDTFRMLKDCDSLRREIIQSPQIIGLLEGFTTAVVEVIERLRGVRKDREILIVHHDDADGLCSAALTERALERETFRTELICLERVYPEVIRKIHSQSKRTIFYCDIGSSHGDLIADSNQGRNFTVILDHHDPVPGYDPNVFDLNLEHYGFKGETDFSGATCCYIFAKGLDEANEDLSYLALTGSCEIPGKLQKLNKTVLKEGIEGGVVSARGKGFLINKFGMTTKQLFSYLQILGSVGYYRRGPYLGVKLALGGMTPEIRTRINELKEERRIANKRIISGLYREGLKQSEHIQWFDSGDAYAGMGTKVVGSICSMLSHRATLVSPKKYLMGFMGVPREVPGYGLLGEELVKVSVRVPKPMQGLIDGAELPSAVQLLREASKGFGIADGHAYAASAVISRDKRDRFLENLERVIGRYSR